MEAGNKTTAPKLPILGLLRSCPRGPKAMFLAWTPDFMGNPSSPNSVMGAPRNCQKNAFCIWNLRLTENEMEWEQGCDPVS